MDEVQIGAELDNLSSNEQEKILLVLPLGRRTAVLGFMREEHAAQIIRQLAPEEAAALLDPLESDDIVDILGLLDESELTIILARLEERMAPEDLRGLEDLLAYDQETAGGIMSPDFIAVSDNVTVARALRTVQDLEDPPEQAFYVYVIDDDERLVGVLSLRTLVTSKPDQRVREVMHSELTLVKSDADQEEVAEIASRYDLVAVPVVDAQHRLLGLITIDDIVDVIREEATEDILKMAGAGEELVATRLFWVSFRARLPWLGAAVAGGILVVLLLKDFHMQIELFPSLAMFMPVIVGMGGCVGTQSSTIVVRGLAVGYVERDKVRRLLIRELGLGLLLGAVYGVVIALASWVLIDDISPLPLAITLVASMIGSMAIAATVGSATPLIWDRLNIDPALATGPFVTTAVDALGLLFYFSVATYILGVDPGAS